MAKKPGQNTEEPGYPVLMPVVVNNSNGTINSLTEIRRLPFAQDEVNNNGAAVQKAIHLTWEALITAVQGYGGICLLKTKK